MASGISFLAGLLTGAAAGVEQGKKIKLAKEENEIRRQQVEATKQLGFAQIAATKENQMASLGLQEKLGMLGIGLDRERIGVDRERIGLGREELGVRREESQADRALRMLMQDSGFQHDIRMSGIGQKYQTEFAEIQAGLRERGAEADYGREIEGAGIKARIGLTLDKERMDHEAGLRKEFAALTGEDLKGKIQLKAADAIWDLRTAMVGRKLSDDAEMAQIMPKLNSTVVASLAANQRPASEISTAIAAIKQVANDIKGGSDDAARKLAPMMQAVMEGDPADPATQAKVNEFFKQVMAAPEPEWKVGSGETGKKSLTKPTNYREYAEQNPGKVDTTRKPMTVSEIDVQRLVFSKPGLKDAAIRAQREANPMMSSIPGLVPEADAARMLADLLNEHPEITGDTAYRAAKVLEMVTRERIAPINLGPQQSTSGGPREGEIRRSGR